MKRFHVHVAVDDLAAFDQSQAARCYARSDKHRITDPQGIAWEKFHMFDQIPTFGADTKKGAEASACGAPVAQPVRFAERGSAGSCC